MDEKKDHDEQMYIVTMNLGVLGEWRGQVTARTDEEAKSEGKRFLLGDHGIMLPFAFPDVSNTADCERVINETLHGMIAKCYPNGIPSGEIIHWVRIKPNWVRIFKPT